MSKKDFIKLAEAIRQISDLQERERAMWRVADVCQRSNDRFDVNRFRKACGV
jgi:hypothetical protein